MLDVMALGSMPNEDQLRTIAAASREEQAQVWKKHKPKKGQPRSPGMRSPARWPNAACRLRPPNSTTSWRKPTASSGRTTCSRPPGEDSRYTTNVEGFFGAQQEWLQNNLPERGTLLPVNEYGQRQLPKKAERVYGKPGKSDLVGHYIDARTGEVETIAYRLPEPKKAGKTGEWRQAPATARRRRRRRRRQPRRPGRT